jgi:hypothetical protein
MRLILVLVFTCLCHTTASAQTADELNAQAKAQLTAQNYAGAVPLLRQAAAEAKLGRPLRNLDGLLREEF